MARNLRNLPKTTAFNDLESVSRSLGETNDCGVKALALAAGITYDQAHFLLECKGRRPGQATNMRALMDCLMGCGKQVRLVPQTEITSRYPGKHAAKRTVTTLQPDRFPAAWRNGRTYLMHVEGHVAVVINGTLHDWTRGQSRHVIGLYEVTSFCSTVY